ncbi:DUF2184 domain-containing protein [Acinetobacter baumannii]|uniref:DUF2184 domain-containing protein n=1 Tax=Acinetobacter baumannii TaxID=470 RepID=UPI001F349D3D|nr:DUF2184 domain-containing protein [Acinetobacter baumannii]MCF1300060.1 DUF2184 domain-containing protein [Acinetobacter baumannii]HAV4522632.1 DUF2184 domain-containing protein [Acinetobacter baumannii]HAV4563989.1 DUF2184 domain-containing protein [Acinetobacter baumannii]
MSKLAAMKLRLTPVAQMVQANIGDAFNLDALAQLFVKLEEFNEMGPQLQQVMDYAKYIPVKPVNAVYGGGEILSRKKGVGMGKDHSGTGNDIPLAEVEYDTVQLPVKVGTISYMYSVFELQAAQKLNLALEADKVEAARLAAEKHLSNIAWYGNALTGVKGFLNQTGVTIVTAQHNWATATIEEVLSDFNASLADAEDLVDGDVSVQPDTYLMASNQYLHLSTRVVADSGGKTFLKFIEENNIFASQGKPLTIRGLGRSNGKGTAGADRSIIYRRDPSCIQMKCDDVTFLAAQPVGVDIKVPGHYKYQGVWLKRVDSLRYLDHV